MALYVRLHLVLALGGAAESAYLIGTGSLDALAVCRGTRDTATMGLIMGVFSPLLILLH